MSKPTKLPEGWKLVSLGEVGTLINGDRGKNYPSQKDFVDNGVPFINAGHIQNGEIDFESMNFISRKRFDLLGSGKVKSGDILYCLRGSLGKTAIIKDIQEGAIASSLVIIRPSEQIRTDYFYRYLASPIGQAEIYKYDNGSSQPNLSAQSLKQYQLPLPPLEEQRRIAAILDKADGVRRKRKEAIRLTEELLKSTFLEMFGDPVTNPKGWEIVKLEKVSESISYGITASADFVPTATKMLRITDIQNGEINWESVPFCSGDKKDIQKYSIVSGDIVFARTGATTGKSFLIRHCPENTLFASYLIRVRPSSLISPEYLAYFFKTEFYWKQIQQNSSGSAQPGVNSSKLKELLIILPPIELQKGFARLDIFIQNNLMKMNNFLHQQDNLFNSLLQRAFRGEL
jgi:type I restriction enzyme S subunit